jgi:nucleoside phosphorylase
MSVEQAKSGAQKSPLKGSLANEKYNVGWICAVYKEYVAASAFLDEEHEGPTYVAEHDNNCYTLGKMSGHDVVIAAMPDGEYGAASAASVARDMLYTFPNIRISLMVGIGGGAPSIKHDIRLGDIVVSSPRDGHGGVFQYDFGKTIQGQKFQETKLLSQPPAVLRAAVTSLRGYYEIHGHRIQEDIAATLDRRPRMRRNFGKPDTSTDRLYIPEAIHPFQNEANCVAACGDDALVPRPARQDYEDDLMIHYGLVASGNLLLKDALLRDRLIQDKDVLCFEMEAAGLMNHFPCLVIRGICDYSDSHKNDAWQGYAAMVAAAYAKDLLKRIPLNKVEAEKRLSEIVYAG